MLWFVAENCSSPVPAVSITAPSERQAGVSGKESNCSEENGSGKDSSHGEESNLQGR